MQEEKQKSTLAWIMEWAGSKKNKYIMSIIFALINVVFKIIPYFVIADVVADIIDGEQDISVYITRAAAVAGSFMVAELFHSISTSLSHKATFEVLANIRKQCLDKLSRVPLGYVKDNSSGNFKNIMVERVDSIETTLAHILPEFTTNIIAPVAVLVYLFVIDWRIALFALVPMLLGILSIMGMFIGYNENFQNTVVKTRALNEAAVEYINGIEVIKAFGKVDSSYEKFTIAAKEGADAFISWMRKCNIFQTLAFVLTPYTLLTVLPIGALYVRNGSLSVPDFVMCIILSIGIVGPLLSVMSYTDDLGTAGTIVGEVTGILTHEELLRPERSDAVPADNDIILKDVTFAYHDREILHGINMQIKSGTVNAIVGPSGSGKSTIAKLIASMWDVDGGSISLGGVDIRRLSLTDYSSRLAYVSQDNYLFNISVMDNIRQGRPDATDDEVREVARQSGCYDFIMELENGFDTIVGGAGGHLSGGERQRISIARAMLKAAPIVILDEATAYTDPENEAVIQAAVARLVAGKTLIVIAHRLSTIADADHIFVISDGCIEEEGTHEELLYAHGLYERMWTAHISAKDTVREGE